MRYIRIVTLLSSAGLLPWAPLMRPCIAQDANRATILAPADVGNVVDRVEKLTDRFKDEFDKAVDHSMIDGTRLEDASKHRADDLHHAAAKLGDVFHDRRDKNDPRVRTQIDRTIATASDLNRVMTAHRFTDQLQRDWAMIRTDLNGLAQVYQLSPVDSR